MAVAALVGSSLGAPLRANGAEFFEAENDGKVILYYFGNIKDTKGQLLDKVTITIKVKNADLNMPFRNDTPGHFRSIDVGKTIEAAGKKVDPSQIEITVSKAGYKMVSAPKVPNKLGAVQVETIVLEAVK